MQLHYPELLPAARYNTGVQDGVNLRKKTAAALCRQQPSYLTLCSGFCRNKYRPSTPALARLWRASANETPAAGGKVVARETSFLSSAQSHFLECLEHCCLPEFLEFVLRRSAEAGVLFRGRGCC